jgi:hypothetical protein
MYKGNGQVSRRGKMHCTTVCKLILPKCVICYFKYLTDLDFDLLQIQICCCKANHQIVWGQKCFCLYFINICHVKIYSKLKFLFYIIYFWYNDPFPRNVIEFGLHVKYSWLKFTKTKFALDCLQWTPQYQISSKSIE